MVFKDFLEYWHYAKTFSDKQKEILLGSLDKEEKDYIIDSCSDNKYDDVLNRNILNQTVEEVKKEFGYDLIDIHYKIIKNKSVYIPTNFWEFVLDKFKDYSDSQLQFILGGIDAIVCKENKQVTLLVPVYSKVRN